MATQTRFELTITLGDDGMQTADDLYGVLTEAASKVQGLFGAYRPIPEDNRRPHSTVTDANGNTVGEWRITDAEVKTPEEIAAAIMAVAEGQDGPFEDGDYNGASLAGYAEKLLVLAARDAQNNTTTTEV